MFDVLSVTVSSGRGTVGVILDSGTSTTIAVKMYPRCAKLYQLDTLLREREALELMDLNSSPFVARLARTFTDGSYYYLGFTCVMSLPPCLSPVPLIACRSCTRPRSQARRRRRSLGAHRGAPVAHF